MKKKTEILDQSAINRALTRIAHEILEKNKEGEDLVLDTIRPRGAALAKRLTEKIKEIDNLTLPIGVLDITVYREDLKKATDSDEPEIKASDIPVDLTGKNVVLIDDVLYTGRTVRAAMDATMDIGRPAQVQLAVLVDRGHRQLPIRADYVGKNIPTSEKEIVVVHVDEIDQADEVAIYEN